MVAPVIQTENLTKDFKKNRAVNDVSLQVSPGIVYGFLGPNGAGKSTTIRMLLTLMRPHYGNVLIFGKNPREHPEVLRRVGSLVEGASFYPYLRAIDNLMVLGNSRGTFEHERATRLLDFVGLSHAARKRVRTFSTGMKQRLGIAAALLNEPELVILDEPTNGMDPAGIREMRVFIRNLAHEEGKTVFVSSHLLGEVQQMCDRVAIINHGKIVAEGNIETLLNQSDEVLVEVSDIVPAQQILREHWQVRLDEENALLRLHASRTEIPKIVRRLVDSQIDIFSITPHRQSLEDFFLEVTGTDPAQEKEKPHA